MRHHFLLMSGFAAVVAVAFVHAAGAWADDTSRDGAKDAASAAQTPTRVPTLAKRNAAAPRETDAGMREVPPDQLGASEPSAKAQEPLNPIPEPQDVPGALQAASFKGVVPGASTKDDVQKAWGKPKAAKHIDGAAVELYSVEPFKQVEVHYADGKVSSIVIRLQRSFAAETVAKLLDLLSVRPVFVSNDLGDVLGQAYPERGVMFVFEPSKARGKFSTGVTEIVLEPISAETFVLRAETVLESRYDLARRDLEQAVALEADNARAHWLLARVLMAIDETDRAVIEAAAAVQHEPGNAQYLVTHAQALGRANRLADALDVANKAVELSESRPHIQARANCLVGDLVASAAKANFKEALGYHLKAIQLATPLAKDPHPAVRIAAKEVLVDANLGAAHDIAWGNWKDKPKAVARWLERAAATADDLAAKEVGGPDLVFHVHARGLGAYVGLRGQLDPEPVAKAALDAGRGLLAAEHDASRKTELEWELGMAMYDAAQVCQNRADHAGALKYGEVAVVYLGKANQSKPSPANEFRLGRLCFRLGAIHAMCDTDHRAAVAWFDRALPYLEHLSPGNNPSDLGRQGQALVSMGVSYWEVGQRAKALDLTQRGIRWMEQSAESGGLERSLLAVPYNNLSAMHRKLGAPDEATRYQEMASRVKEEKLK